ncbi:hypothetical protein Tco_0386838 [Tanacetum coccineum]
MRTNLSATSVRQNRYATDSTVKKLDTITRKYMSNPRRYLYSSSTMVLKAHVDCNLKLLIILWKIYWENGEVEMIKCTIFGCFRKSTCYIRDLKGNDLLTGSRGTDLYSITLQDSTTLNPICLMAKATSSQADGENLDKMKEKGDACIFIGYSTQSKAYNVFNKRTRIRVETIHVNFDELPQMASDHVSSDPGPQCSTTILEQESLSLDPQSQENVSQTAETETTSNKLSNCFYVRLFSEYSRTSPVVSMSLSLFVHAADILVLQRQQHTPLTILQQTM